MAQSTVELIVDAQKAINPLKRVTAETKKLEGVTRDVNGRLRDAKGRFVGTGRAATGAAKGVDRLSASIKRLVAGLAFFQAGKFVLVKTAELERQTRSLQVLTGSLGNARNIIAELQQFGAVTPFTSSELIETAKRLKAFGFQTEEVVDVTKRLADVAGATGADLGGIATAFGQIQAKGRLQGEELLQLQERGVSLQDELQKMYKLTADEFRKALEGGRISADAVNLALQNITDTGGKYAGGAIAQSDTLAGKFSTLIDGIENISRTIGGLLSPALKGALGLAIDVINSINAAINAQRRLSGFGISDTERDKLFKQATEEAKQLALLRGRGTLDPGEFNRIKQQRFSDLINQFAFETGQLIPEIDVPTQKSLPDLLRGGTGQTDAERITEQLERQVAALGESKLLAAGKTAEDRAQIQLGIDLANFERLRTAENSNVVDKAIEARQALFDQKQETAALIEQDKQRFESFQEQLKHQDELRTKIAEQKNAYEELNTTFRNGIVDGILAAVEGTRSLSDSLVGILKQMARLILQQQLLNSLKGFNLFGGGGGGTSGFGASVLTSGIKFFANGGRPPVGRPSVVGERGPELFIPDRAGTIVPNGGFGGANVVVNVDASGSSVQGDEGSSRQLGALIGAAVQGEIIKQQRPGGLLSR